jgi:hypothetical protein
MWFADRALSLASCRTSPAAGLAVFWKTDLEKRIRRMKFKTALITLALGAFCVGNLNAFQSLPGYLKNGYKDDKDYKPFLETVEGLKTKCDVCHKPGADKKAKGHGLNDFGKVYHDRFKHKDFSAADKEKKTEEAMKIFKDAWEKSILEKNADGKVFGELIKEGKLPGKND